MLCKGFDPLTFCSIRAITTLTVVESGFNGLGIMIVPSFSKNSCQKVLFHEGKTNAKKE